MRIAVIGSGISGLGSAYLLNQQADVHLFECDSRIGGHSHTVDADFNGVKVPVDTGFIVYNPLNYPNLMALFDRLNVTWINTDMSFAVSLRDGGCEYEGSLRGLVAQPGNLLRPRYWAMLADLVRFYRTGYKNAFAGPAGESLNEFLLREGYGEAFVQDHLLPMGASIWSCSAAMMRDYPVRSLLQFLENHQLLNFIERPVWRTVKGGSREYVNRIAGTLGGIKGGQIHLNTQITGLRRDQGGVILSIAGEGDVWFDKVVLAAHADQSLALISDASQQERSILADFRFQPNRAVLHSDPALMPNRRAAWGAWNYIGAKDSIGVKDSGGGALCLTYWMNRLQSIDQAYPLFETLNPHFEPDPALVHGSYSYDHPVFDEKAVAAEHRLRQIQGVGNLFYAGAWTGHGFHEDGLKSAIAVARTLGVEIPWETTIQPYSQIEGNALQNDTREIA
ncbi:MAG: NAD(P)-binding protein [Bacteroidetes bacterium]|nr:NAD(P)-binding protein [Bacteroidota bacterium]